MIGTRREKENPLIGAKVKPGLRRAHSETEHPCRRPTVVKIRGVPFCERGIREREAHCPSAELAWPEAAKRRLRYARRSAPEDAGRRT